MKKKPSSEKFFALACYFEASLVIVAVVLGWFSGIDPFKNIIFSEPAIFIGIVGTLPLIILFIALNQIDNKYLQQIRKILLDTFGPAMYKQHWANLLILAAIAGIAEEILFRGVIQPWMETSWGMTAGLIGSNLIFGLVHAVTPLYAVMATLFGIYLSLSMDYGEHRNLLTPIIIHGLYDFLAFLIILSAYRLQKHNSVEKP